MSEAGSDSAGTPGVTRARVRKRGAAAAAPRPPRGLMTFEFAMMAPAMVILAILSLIPFFTLIVMSFSEVKTLGGVSLEFNGLDNWIAVLTNGSVWLSWGRSLIFWGSIIGLEMVLGFIFAVILHNLLRARSILLSIVLLPMFLAPVMVGLLGRFMLDSTIGLYAHALRTIGISTDVFASPGSALIAVILIDVWQWTPLVALIMLAGLTSVPTSTLEAAAVDGAGFFRQVLSIMVPQMKPIVLVALLVRTMDAIRYYDIITATTNGGPADATKIVPLKLYEFAFRFNNQIGHAAVLGLTMLILSIALAKAFIGVFADRTQADTTREKRS